MRLVFLDGAQHRDGPLRGGAAIKIHERSAVDGALENREITPDALDVEQPGRARLGRRSQPSEQLLQRGGFVQLTRKTLLDLPPQLGHFDLRDHVLEKRPLSRRCAVSRSNAARQQVKQHVVVQLAGRCAVVAADIVRVDLELRPDIDLGIGARQQPAQRLTRVRAVSAFADDDLSVERDARAAGGDAAEALLGARVRGNVLDQREGVVDLVLAADARRSKPTSARSPASCTCTVDRAESRRGSRMCS